MHTYTNEDMQTHTHTHTHIYIYISLLIHAHLHLQIMLSITCSFSCPSYHTDLLPYLAFFILLTLSLHFIITVEILSATPATRPHYKLAGCAVRVRSDVRWSDRSRAGECCSTATGWEERGGKRRGWMGCAVLCCAACCVCNVCMCGVCVCECSVMGWYGMGCVVEYSAVHDMQMCVRACACVCVNVRVCICMSFLYLHFLPLHYLSPSHSHPFIPSLLSPSCSLLSSTYICCSTSLSTSLSFSFASSSPSR